MQSGCSLVPASVTLEEQAEKPLFNEGEGLDATRNIPIMGREILCAQHEAHGPSVA